jgi:DNA polymerase-3 subunit delta'
MLATAEMLAGLPEQDEARRLLAAALTEGPAHAYLFHGPRGVGKRATALRFAGALIGDPDRVERRCHPDLYVLEPIGDQIRIDAIRELRHDLHMRPFEAARRVYLVFGADLMNEDAADALLKDLEEPPAYAVVILVADQLAPLPETIRSRCQPVPFRRLSRRTLEQVLHARRPDLPAEEIGVVARVAAGRLDRAERLLDPESASRRAALIAIARAVYLDERFDPLAATQTILEHARAAGAAAKDEVDTSRLDMTGRELDQHLRRIARGAEREEILGALDLLAGWYRDLLAASVGAGDAAFNSDHSGTIASDSATVGLRAMRAVELVAETHRRFELNLNPPLALEALLIEIRGAVRPA